MENEQKKGKKRHYGLASGATLFVDSEKGISLVGNKTLTLPDDDSEAVSRAIQAGGLVEVDEPFKEEETEEGTEK